MVVFPQAYDLMNPCQSHVQFQVYYSEAKEAKELPARAVDADTSLRAVTGARLDVRVHTIGVEYRQYRLLRL